MRTTWWSHSRLAPFACCRHIALSKASRFNGLPITHGLSLLVGPVDQVQAALAGYLALVGEGPDDLDGLCKGPASILWVRYAKASLEALGVARRGVVSGSDGLRYRWRRGTGGEQCQEG